MTELGTELKMESHDSRVSIAGGRTLNTQKIKESILPNLPYLFIFWLISWTARKAGGKPARTQAKTQGKTVSTVRQSNVGWFAARMSGLDPIF